MLTLRRCSPCVIECDVTVCVYNARLKCQLSGDSWTPINSIKSSPECFVLLIQILYPLQFGAHDQDCILAKRRGKFVRCINKLRMGIADSTRTMILVQSIRKFFQWDDSTTPVNGSGIELRGIQVRSDGSDRTCLECRTRASVAPKTTERSGLMKVGLNRTHINLQAPSRWDVNVELGIGWTRDRMRTERCDGRRPGGVPHASVPYLVQMDQIACRLVAT